MKEEMKIVYQHYIPDDLIVEFDKLRVGDHLQVEIKTKKAEQKYYNFNGPEIADILIYVEEHTTELIVSGFLVNVAYDMFKSGLKLLWTGISNLAVKKMNANDKQTDKKKSISITLAVKDRAIEVILEGDVEDKQANILIDEAFKFISPESLNEAFNNPDFIEQPTDKPKIRLRFDKEKQVWQPENFGEHRRQVSDFQKWAEKKFNN
ncbi:MAG: hypothetical protein ABW007_22095 [Chitinophagaceae bacterium]